MKKLQSHRTPTYIFILAAVLLSWGIAITKTVMASSYPQFGSNGLRFTDFQYNYIFAFLFQ